MQTTAKKNVLITGASGMVGTALSKRLSGEGYEVYALDRHSRDAPFYYHAGTQSVHLDPLLPLYAVINLAGANIADKAWSTTRKQQILESRVHLTHALAKALSQLPVKPEHFLSASAIGFYGNQQVDTVDESSPAGQGFLSQVAQQWEQATLPASQAGIDTTILRFAVVLSPSGGMLKQMWLPYKLGLGGPIAKGDQYISWISLEDAVNIVCHLVRTKSELDVINLVAKEPVTNEQFSSQLARSLHRPNMMRLPGWLVRALFGEMGETLLLGSSKVQSKTLESLGLALEHPDLRSYFNSRVQK
ncbi:MAG: TIGR01777 family oxidoreductase [Pseudohongiellaceae bacterium]|nr:TIGR01777 family oxidoreductase [Pseudohongiellaceae bacterium]